MTKEQENAKTGQRLRSSKSKIKSEVVEMYVTRLQNSNCKTDFYYT
jgi:hypothetical protein